MIGALFFLNIRCCMIEFLEWCCGTVYSLCYVGLLNLTLTCSSWFIFLNALCLARDYLLAYSVTKVTVFLSCKQVLSPSHNENCE